MYIMSLNPKIWGPPTWIFLHSVTLSYPECPTITDKTNIKEFFYAIGKILPCATCRINYVKHITKYPLTDKILSSKKNLVKWLLNIRNEGRKTYGKPPISYEKLLIKYTKMYSNKTNYNKIYLFVLMFIVILFVCQFAYVRFKSLNNINMLF